MSVYAAYVQLDASATLSSAGISNGDSLTVREKAAPDPPPLTAVAPANSNGVAGFGISAEENAGQLADNLVGRNIS